MWKQLLGVGLILSVPQKCKRNSFLFHILVADPQRRRELCGASGFEYGGDLSKDSSLRFSEKSEDFVC